MKTILVLLILFFAIALPALGELTDVDLNQIRLIVNDAIDASEKRFEKRFDEKIKASETRMKEHIMQQVDSLKTPVAWLIGILVTVIALIGIPLVVLTIMIGWRSIKDNSQEKINQELREEIETPEATADCTTMEGTRPLDNDEIRRVSTCFTGTFEARNRGLFMIGVSAGGRISELLSLTIGDVYQNRSAVTDLLFQRTICQRWRGIKNRSSQR